MFAYPFRNIHRVKINVLSTSIREDNHHVRKIQDFNSYLIVELDSKMMVIEASKSLELDVDVVAHK